MDNKDNNTFEDNLKDEPIADKSEEASKGSVFADENVFTNESVFSDETVFSDEDGRRSKAKAKEKAPEEEKLSPKEERLRRRMKERKKRRIRAIIVLTAFVLLVAAAITLFVVDKKGMLNVTVINVEGNSHYSEAYIVKRSGVTAETGLFTLKKGHVVSSLEDLPYVKDAGVSKKYPHTVNITVSERTPVYAAYFGGYYVYLDEDMIMLEKSNVPGDLIVLEGFVPKRLVIGEEFVPTDQDNFKVALEMAQTISEYGIPVYKVSYSNLFMRVYLTETIVCEGTYENLKKYSSNLGEILTSLEEQRIERGTITVGDNGYISLSPKL